MSPVKLEGGARGGRGWLLSAGIWTALLAVLGVLAVGMHFAAEGSFARRLGALEIAAFAHSRSGWPQGINYFGPPASGGKRIWCLRVRNDHWLLVRH